MRRVFDYIIQKTCTSYLKYVQQVGRFNHATAKNIQSGGWLQISVNVANTCGSISKTAMMGMHPAKQAITAQLGSRQVW